MMRLIHYACVLLLATACLVSTSASSVARNLPQNDPARPTPVNALRSARTIFIRSKSIFFKPATLENELLKRPEFQLWGLVITREEADADLIIEVERKVFSKFTFSVIDPRTNTVVASGKLSSLGGTVEHKIAKKFVSRMKAVRPLTSSTQTQ